MWAQAKKRQPDEESIGCTYKQGYRANQAGKIVEGEGGGRTGEDDERVLHLQPCSDQIESKDCKPRTKPAQLLDGL